jgi:hypothetical protein
LYFKYQEKTIFCWPCSAGDGFYAACSHFRAVHIFSESLVSDPDYFRGFPCLGLDDFDNDFLKGDCFECEPSAEYSRGCGKAGIDAHLYGNGSFYFPTRVDDPADGVDELGGAQRQSLVKALKHYWLLA